MKVYVYIAGPYTQGDTVENTHRAINTAAMLRALGYTPFVPHLAMLWQMVQPMPPDYWYAWDNDWLMKCDCVYRRPGPSWGSDEECKLAESLGIPVFYCDEDNPHKQLQDLMKMFPLEKE